MEILLKHRTAVAVCTALVAASAALIPASAFASIIARPANNLGLVGYWSFDEGTSTTAHDSSGNGYTGTLVSPASLGWTSGKHGKAINFTGTTGSYVDVGAGLDFSSNKEFTVSFWVKGPSTQTNGAGLVARGTGAGGEQYAFDVAGNTFRFFTRDSGGVVNGSISASTGPNPNTWTLVTGTFSGSGLTQTLYINGVALTPATVTSSLLAGSHSTTIGARQTGSTSYDLAFNGSIDDVRIYNRALSATEVAALYTQGEAKLKQANNLGLVGYWSLDEGTSTTAHDGSGNGNTGTLAGTSLPTWTSGKYGKALNFVNNAYVTTPVNITPTSVTMTAWVKRSGTEPAWAGVLFSRNSTPVGMDITGVANEISYTDNTDWGVSTGFILPLNQWAFVALVLTSTNATMYMGTTPGNLQSVSNVSSYASWPINSLKIGADYTDGSRNFLGSIDDARIYSRALSATEIAALYANSGATHANTSSANLTNGTTLGNGLVGLWTFDGADTVWSSATAGNEIDRSGNGNTGTLNNMNRATSPMVGKLGQALKFDGTASNVAIANTSAFQVASVKTVSLWFYSSNIAQVIPRIIEESQDASNAWSLAIRDSTQAAPNLNLEADFDVNGVRSAFMTPQGSIAQNKWYHAVVVFNGSAVVSIYLNGVSQTLTQDGAGLLHGSSPLMTIGMRTDNQRWFAGLIDDVRVYNRALSASEVKQLYLMGK